MMSDFDFRFGGIARLYGTATLSRFRAAHVMVVGIGGVGSWVVEALARSGIGRLTLVDLDEVCVSNINRQLHALDSTVGRSKVEVMVERVRTISPEARVEGRVEFFTADTASRLLGLETDSISEDRPDFVVDAIDAMSNKVRLIALCQGAGIPLVVCGGAGGRRDPTAVRVADLATVTHDRLLSEVRKRLRREHGFSRTSKKLRIECVHSAEAPVFPDRDGQVCATRASDNELPLRLNCESGFGSATQVTGTFGFAAAARVLARLADPIPKSVPNPESQPSLPQSSILG
ncbi:MAG: tRNA threonylcarbamoyladenosine dehydratase [Verrucomicrobiota bacterium]|jgi:tRNA A37 threonylcarbamoyladenosine dehydratase|nr:tRNA threonylcarbamoyladenosine dehydratase [Verrucomicrobiota bacterium]